MIQIRTVAVAADGEESQTDYRGACPNSVIVVLDDGRLITINTDHIVVHGPDMETLMDSPLPTVDQVVVTDTWNYVGQDAPEGAGEAVETSRG